MLSRMDFDTLNRMTARLLETRNIKAYRLEDGDPGIRLDWINPGGYGVNTLICVRNFKALTQMIESIPTPWLQTQ